jgi:BirA family biotin operon repressor/biotin-[acetyl-CoA-carboxylase] ligase
VTIADWPGGIGLCRHKILDSTNEEAKRLARRGERGPLWITALQQTAGRGRHGREWVSESGNLFATLLIAVAQRNSPQIAFIAGIAAADLCARYVPRESVKLKWPNDVLIGGRKAAGVLVEQVTGRLVAAGIGIDLAHCPAGMGAVSIAEIAGFAPHPDEVLAALAHGMNEWLIFWREHGFGRIRREWLNRAGGIGKSIRAVTAEACFDGIFESLDNDGALLLRDGAGASHRITAADVFYGG